MHKEPGERRDFLPGFVTTLARLGATIVLEAGYGSGMGLSESEYLRPDGSVRFVSRPEAFGQDLVLVLRYPDDSDIEAMHPGACLMSMVHYATRPGRVEQLRRRKLEAISLDSIKDDSGRRLIENLRSVAWNGIEAAMGVLRKIYPAPGFESPYRPPIRVTLLGAGAVGAHVIQAATRYGDDALRRRLAARGVPGAQVTVVDFDITCHPPLLQPLLGQTDVLVDATQRPDPSRAVVSALQVGLLPAHAVILDLSVDPSDPATEPPHVKGIEGIPQGNLDQYVFAPDDPAFDQQPAPLAAAHRRHVVSCYSWPGVYPERCMHIYGRQLQPILRTLISKGGPARVDPAGRFFERCIARAQCSRLNEASQPA